MSGNPVQSAVWNARKPALSTVPTIGLMNVTSSLRCASKRAWSRALAADIAALKSFAFEVAVSVAVCSCAIAMWLPLPALLFVVDLVLQSACLAEHVRHRGP